jgi:dsRNA-specific ribonuclease
MNNPIVELSEFCQKRFGANIETEVLGKTGADHLPTVKVRITTPDNKVFEASSSNKRLAKQNAAKEAIEFYNR